MMYNILHLFLMQPKDSVVIKQKQVAAVDILHFRVMYVYSCGAH